MKIFIEKFGDGYTLCITLQTACHFRSVHKSAEDILLVVASHLKVPVYLEPPPKSDTAEAVEQPLTQVKSSAIATASGTLPANIKDQFTRFIAEQKDMPSEFAEVVNDNFWDLVGR